MPSPTSRSAFRPAAIDTANLTPTVRKSVPTSASATLTPTSISVGGAQREMSAAQQTWHTDALDLASKVADLQDQPVRLTGVPNSQATIRRVLWAVAAVAAVITVAAVAVAIAAAVAATALTGLLPFLAVIPALPLVSALIGIPFLAVTWIAGWAARARSAVSTPATERPASVNAPLGSPQARRMVVQDAIVVPNSPSERRPTSRMGSMSYLEDTSPYESDSAHSFSTVQLDDDVAAQSPAAPTFSRPRAGSAPAIFASVDTDAVQTLPRAASDGDVRTQVFEALSRPDSPRSASRDAAVQPGSPRSVRDTVPAGQPGSPVAVAVPSPEETKFAEDFLKGQPAFQDDLDMILKARGEQATVLTQVQMAIKHPRFAVEMKKGFKEAEGKKPSAYAKESFDHVLKVAANADSLAVDSADFSKVLNAVVKYGPSRDREAFKKFQQTMRLVSDNRSFFPDDSVDYVIQGFIQDSIGVTKTANNEMVFESLRDGSADASKAFAQALLAFCDNNKAVALATSRVMTQKGMGAMVMLSNEVVQGNDPVGKESNVKMLVPTRGGTAESASFTVSKTAQAIRVRTSFKSTVGQVQYTNKPSVMTEPDSHFDTSGDYVIDLQTGKITLEKISYDLSTIKYAK